MNTFLERIPFDNSSAARFVYVIQRILSFGLSMIHLSLIHIYAGGKAAICRFHIPVPVVDADDFCVVDCFHQDVYKRQGMDYEIMTSDDVVIVTPQGKIVEGTRPVSYTHLFWK